MKEAELRGHIGSLGREVVVKIKEKAQVRYER